MSKKASRKLRNQTTKGQPTPSRHQQHKEQSAFKLKHEDTAYAFVNYFKWNKITYDFGPKLTLLPKPVVTTKETTEKKSRMAKFTSVEKKFLELGRFLLSERAGEYGYAMKLVKRGYITALSSKTKHITVFAITPAGERARAGMSLLKAVQGKQGIASGAQFGHAVAAAG